MGTHNRYPVLMGGVAVFLSSVCVIVCSSSVAMGVPVDTGDRADGDEDGG
jgi:hypothetical protein